jgi:hypothetical protein
LRKAAGIQEGVRGFGEASKAHQQRQILREKSQPLRAEDGTILWGQVGAMRTVKRLLMSPSGGIQRRGHSGPQSGMVRPAWTLLRVDLCVGHKCCPLPAGSYTKDYLCSPFILTSILGLPVLAFPCPGW